MLLLLLLSPGLRGDSRWRVLLVPTRAFATAAIFWLALLPPGLAKAALPGDVTLWHYHLDHLGTPHSMTDASGNLYRQTRTTAYGEVRGRYDGSGNVVAAEVALRHEFTGYQSEEKSGLQYAGARYYLPELGVFTSHDPAGQFPSPYAYGPGDPINGTDPTGEDFGLGALLLVISIAAAVARFIYTGIKTGDWGAAGFGLVVNLAAIAIAYAVAQITAPYVSQFLNRLSDAWRTAYTYASRGYTAYRTAKAASRGDYITAAEIGLSLMAVAYNDYAGSYQPVGGGGANQPVAGGLAFGQAEAGSLSSESEYVFIPAPQELIGARRYYIWRYSKSPDEFWHGTGSNYFIDYGLPMFDKFQILRKDASLELKRFIDTTAVELQELLEWALYEDPSIGYNRNSLTEAAFDTHSQAYVRGGFFNLPITDQLRVLNTIGGELLDPRTIREGIESLQGR